MKVYPMRSEAQALEALRTFLHETGIPIELHTGRAKAPTLSEWRDICRKFNIYMAATEPYSPWQNPAELAGGIMKRRCKGIMRATNTPVVLWDYCLEYLA